MANWLIFFLIISAFTNVATAVEQVSEVTYTAYEATCELGRKQ